MEITCIYTAFTLRFRTVLGQRTVLARIGCEQCEYRFILLLRNHISIVPAWLFREGVPHALPVITIHALWLAGSSSSPSQMLVGGSAYDAARVFFDTGDI